VVCVWCLSGVCECVNYVCLVCMWYVNCVFVRCVCGIVSVCVMYMWCAYSAYVSDVCVCLCLCVYYVFMYMRICVVGMCIGMMWCVCVNFVCVYVCVCVSQRMTLSFYHAGPWNQIQVVKLD